MNVRAFVISLRRTPQRLAWFLSTNTTANTQYEWVAGIDGLEIQDCLRNSRLVSSQALENWTPGSIGSALSHLYCWQKCLSLNEPILVLEDDAVLAPDWAKQIKYLAQQQLDWDLLLLGWNYNSVLQSRCEAGIETIRLFEPAFPSHEQIQAVFDLNREHQLERLICTFGLPGYLISPQGAKTLLNKLPPLHSNMLPMTSGIPATKPTTLDGMLNHFYPRIKAWVVNPPLAIALNDPNTSLTLDRPTIQNFG